jgi:hypothetical protein
MSTVLRPLEFEALQMRATHISIAQVDSLDSFWHSGRILTWVTLRPTTNFRGAKSLLRVLVPGGTVGTISQIVADGPRFEVGQTSLYFLEPMTKFDGFRLVGFTQGKVNQTGVMAEQFTVWARRLKSTSDLKLPLQSDPLGGHR